MGFFRGAILNHLRYLVTLQKTILFSQIFGWSYTMDQITFDSNCAGKWLIEDKYKISCSFVETASSEGLVGAAGRFNRKLKVC